MFLTFSYDDLRDNAALHCLRFLLFFQTVEALEQKRASVLTFQHPAGGFINGSNQCS